MLKEELDAYEKGSYNDNDLNYGMIKFSKFV
jgi:hypothetical protein